MNNTQRFFRYTLSWTILILFFAFLQNREWTFLTISLIILVSLLAAIVIAALSLLIRQLLGNKTTNREDVKITSTTTPTSLSYKLVDFFTTTIFLSLINYYYLRDIIPFFQNPYKCILIAGIAAVFLALYRDKIKIWFKSKLRPGK